MSFKLLVAIFALAATVQNAKAQPTLDELNASALCATHNAEGRYSGTIQDHGHADIYIVCTGNQFIGATWKMNGPGSTSVSLTHFAIDGDQLTLASFSLSPGEAVGLPSTATPAIRLELSVAALQSGILQGTFKTASRPQPKRVQAERDLYFPSPLEQPRVANGTPGTFVYDGALGQTHMTSPIFIDLDVISGVTRVSVADAASSYYTLMEGMSATPRNDVVYAGSGAGGQEGVIMPMIQIRGRFLTTDIFEFYYFNTLYGFAGPYRAKRYQVPFQDAPLLQKVPGT